MSQSSPPIPSDDWKTELKKKIEALGPHRCNCCKKSTVMPVFKGETDSICWWCIRFDQGGVGGHA